MAQIKYDQAGNAWDVSSGTPVLVRMAAPAPITTKQAPPGYQYQGPQAAATLQRTLQEVAQAQATAAANTRKTNAEAKSAEIKAQTDAINFRNTMGQIPGDPSLKGEAYLKSLPAGMADMVRAMDDGRLGVPINMRNPQMMQVVAAATHYDPSFDAAKYNTRLSALRSGAVGKIGDSDNALNTAIAHAGLLWDQVNGTASHDFNPAFLAKTVNALENAVNSGSAGLVTYNDTAQKLGGEEAKAYGIGTGGERQTMTANFNPNLPLSAKQAAIHNAMDLFASKIAANLHQYQWGNMGNEKPSLDLLDPQARQTLQRIAPDVLNKYFSDKPDPMAAAIGVSSYKGGDNPPPPSGNGAPPIGPSGPTPPQADYSGMVGGPGASLATMDPNSKLGAFKQTYRNAYDPVVAGTLAAFIRKGAPYSTVATYLKNQGGSVPDEKTYNSAVQFAKRHNGAVNVEADRSIPTTLGERLSSSPGAAFITGAGSAGTAGLLDAGIRSLVGPDYDANRAALAATNPGADLLGNVAGGAASMIGVGSLAKGVLASGAKGGLARNLLALSLKYPKTAGAVGDAAYGSLYGANENPDNPLAGAATGAVVAPIASVAGTGLTKALGAALQGVTNPAVQRLSDAGIPMTVGDVLGGTAKKAQDALTSVFGPGNMVSRRYIDQRRALNQLAFNRAGEPIGANVNQVGQAGIDALDAAKSKAYATALNPISLDLNTPQAMGDIGTAMKLGLGIPNVDQARDIATGAINNYIGNGAPGGIMSGTNFQQAYRGLSRTAGSAKDRIYGYEIGQALGQGKDALVNALQAQSPGAFEGFQAANTANRNLNVLANAVNTAKNQISDNGEVLFTPAQLGSAATANAKKYGSSISAASGNRPFNQLINDAQQVMSSKLPESGTVPRAAITAAATGGFGGLGYGANGNEGAVEGAAIPLGALTLFGTRAGQQLLTAALLKRTLADQAAGRTLRKYPQIGGDILAAAGIPLLDSPAP